MYHKLISLVVIPAFLLIAASPALAFQNVELIQGTPTLAQIESPSSDQNVASRKNGLAEIIDSLGELNLDEGALAIIITGSIIFFAVFIWGISRVISATRGHIINIGNDGKISSTGKFQTDEADI